MNVSPTDDAPSPANDGRMKLRPSVVKLLSGNYDQQAKRLRISRKHWSELRHGHVGIGFRAARAIAAELDLPIDAVIERAA